jgi:serpin B
MHTPAESSPQAGTLVGALNGLGFRLLAILSESAGRGNTFLSPASIALALAMANAGASGTTSRAITRAIGLSGSPADQIDEASAAWLKTMGRLDPGVNVTVANSAWTATGHAPERSYARLLKSAYRAEMHGLSPEPEAAARQVNSWVDAATEGRIVMLVSAGDLAGAILVLANAIYFKGLWSRPFDPALTVERPFGTRGKRRPRLPMMSQTGSFAYFENELMQVVRLPYGQGRVAMLICLPKPERDLVDLGQRLRLANWRDWRAGLREREGTVALPRFSADFRSDVLPQLTRLGGKALTQADFERIGCGPLRISRVVHAARLEVDEAGTRAAAATAMLMRKAMFTPPFTMSVDRPFFFAIEDGLTGAVLFLGFVSDPEPLRQENP